MQAAYPGDERVPWAFYRMDGAPYAKHKASSSGLPNRSLLWGRANLRAKR